MSVIFSMIGLVTAIAGYEVDLYYDGFKRLGELSDIKSND